MKIGKGTSCSGIPQIPNQQPIKIDMNQIIASHGLKLATDADILAEAEKRGLIKKQGLI